MKKIILAAAAAWVLAGCQAPTVETATVYTLTFDANGATGGTVPTPKSAGPNQAVALPGNPGGLERTGYVFRGWSVSNTQNSQGWNEGETYYIPSDKTLYAVWLTFSLVTYDGSGNTGGSVPVDATEYAYAETVTVLGNTGELTKNQVDSHFLGWYTDEDGNGSLLQAGQTVAMPSGSLGFYAAWAGEVSTFAGSGTAAFANGTGTGASFDKPGHLVVVDGNLYVADTNNRRIRKIMLSTGEVSTFAGSGSIGDADGTPGSATFRQPSAITSDGTTLFVTDSVGYRIRTVSLADGTVGTLAGSGAQGHADNENGLAATFSYAYGIATDGTNLYVADTGNQKIRKVVIATGVVSTLAGSDTAGSDDGTGTSARFNIPYGIAYADGKLYVGDGGNHSIRQIVVSTGEVTTIVGNPANDSYRDGVGPSAGLRTPTDLTTDGTNLYFLDMAAGKVRKLVLSSKRVTTIAGSSPGFAEGIGSAAKFQFNGSDGLALVENTLFVSDSFNARIRAIQ